jgi:hypothetical protein
MDHGVFRHYLTPAEMLPSRGRAGARPKVTTPTHQAESAPQT